MSSQSPEPPRGPEAALAFPGPQTNQPLPWFKDPSVAFPAPELRWKPRGDEPVGEPVDWPAFDGERFDPDNAIPFDAVPRLRKRRRGWCEGRQRFFIFALSRCGSVARAARSVGMSPRTAYRLLEAPGAASFAAAWDRALAEGMERVRTDALGRALGGEFVPVFRRGKLVRVEHRRCDRLALALLSGRPQEIESYRRTALSRHLHKRDLAEHDARKAAAAKAYREELEAMIDLGEAKARAARRPRITRL